MEQSTGTIQSYPLYVLTKELAEKFIDQISYLLAQIPQVIITKDEILAGKKGERVLYGKWDLSLIVMQENKVIAVLIVYERKGENNVQYPFHTLYLSDLAVHPDYQRHGIGKALLEYVIDSTKSKGLKYLEGEPNISIQTNKAEFNSYVQHFYESLGFVKRAEKIYEDRIDNIYGLTFTTSKCEVKQLSNRNENVIHQTISKLNNSYS